MVGLSRRRLCSPSGARFASDTGGASRRFMYSRPTRLDCRYVRVGATPDKERLHAAKSNAVLTDSSRQLNEVPQGLPFGILALVAVVNDTEPPSTPQSTVVPPPLRRSLITSELHDDRFHVGMLDRSFPKPSHADSDHLAASKTEPAQRLLSPISRVCNCMQLHAYVTGVQHACYIFAQNAITNQMHNPRITCNYMHGIYSCSEHDYIPITCTETSWTGHVLGLYMVCDWHVNNTRQIFWSTTRITC